MNLRNFLKATILTFIVCGCDKTKSDEIYFAFDEKALTKQYTTADTLQLSLDNFRNKAVDSVVYYVDDNRVASLKGLGKHPFALKESKFGYHYLMALVFFDAQTTAQEVKGRIEVVSSVAPKALTYTIVNTYVHDENSFIEGLEFYRDTLFEGTGEYGDSRLLKTDYKTGKILKSHALTDEFFGEGITILNGKVYQLTYKEKKGFVYNADTFKLEQTFAYDKDIEGWGMANDGEFIYHSDGTEKIWKMDPKTFKMIDYINVYSPSGKIKSVNELEIIDGKFWGNIWQKDAVAVINMKTGAVEAVIDFSALRSQIKGKNAEVLNGIAYNPKTKTIFITGKYWEKMFEISINTPN